MKDKSAYIFTETLNLYQHSGIKGVTMDDVAKKLSISKKTLYKYVSDKVDLIEKCLFFDFERKTKEFDIIISESKNAIDEISDMVKVFSYMIKTYYPVILNELEIYYPEIHEKIEIREMERVYNLLKSNFIKGKQQKLYRQNIDCDLIAKMFIIFYFSRIDNEIVSCRDFANPEALKEFFSYHLYASCTEKGFQALAKI